MRILVCGSRTYANPNKVYEILKRYADQNPTIIQGEAPGADKCGKLAAQVLGFPVECYPADWKRYRNGAGPKRNKQMLDTGVDLVLAFWDGQSSGTKDMMRQARDAQIEVKVYR